MAIGIGDKVAVAGQGVPWLVVDVEGHLVICARPRFYASGRREISEAPIHSSALVVLAKAR